MTRSDGLQALRGLAALMVFVWHLPFQARLLDPGIHTSLSHSRLYVGVYIFFALSGYLMTYKLAASPAQFAIARCRRIFPAYWTALILGAVLVVLTGGPFLLDAKLFAVWPAGHNLGTRVPYWTLVYEMAFYCVVFVSLLIGRRYALAIIAAALTASVLASNGEVFFPTLPGLATSAISAYFLAGVIVGQLPRPSRQWLSAVLALSGALLFWGLPGLSGFTRTLCDATAAGLIIMAGLSWTPRGAPGKALCFLGDCSYGVYLSHVIFMSLVVFAIQATGARLTGEETMALLALIAAAPCIAFGWLDWKAQAFLKGLHPLRSLDMLRGNRPGNSIFRAKSQPLAFPPQK